MWCLQLFPELLLRLFRDGFTVFSAHTPASMCSVCLRLNLSTCMSVKVWDECEGDFSLAEMRRLFFVPHGCWRRSKNSMELSVIFKRHTSCIAANGSSISFVFRGVSIFFNNVMVFFYNHFYIFTGLNENQFVFFFRKKKISAQIFILFIYLFLVIWHLNVDRSEMSPSLQNIGHPLFQTDQ